MLQDHHFRVTGFHFVKFAMQKGMKGVLPESVSVSFSVSPPKNTLKQRKHVTHATYTRDSQKSASKAKADKDSVVPVMTPAFWYSPTCLVKLGTGFCRGFVWIHIMWGYNFINTCFFSGGFKKKVGLETYHYPKQRQYIPGIFRWSCKKKLSFFGQKAWTCRTNHHHIFKKFVFRKLVGFAFRKLVILLMEEIRRSNKLRLVDLPPLFARVFYTSPFGDHRISEPINQVDLSYLKLGLLRIDLLFGALAPNKADHVLFYAQEACALFNGVWFDVPSGKLT